MAVRRIPTPRALIPAARSLNRGLAELLSPGSTGAPLTPSPTRSAFVQELLTQSQRNLGRPAFSAPEAASIALAPIMAALLGKREEAAQQQASEQTAGRQQALVSALNRATNPNLPPAQRAAASQAVNTIASGLGPDNPVATAVQSGIINQSFSPPPTREREKAVTEVGKINQDVREGNITPDTGQALREAAFNKDQLSIGKAETDLRKEFNDHVSTFSSGLISLENARNLIALEDNPVGAQAALTAFVRAIDNSVVRPSEQQMYQNIFGVAQGLENRIGQLLGQGAFSEQSKDEISEAIDALAKSAETYIQRNVSFYNRLAKTSGLRPGNVTGGFSVSARKPPREDKPVEAAPRGAPIMEIP